MSDTGKEPVFLDGTEFHNCAEVVPVEQSVLAVVPVEAPPVEVAPVEVAQVEVADLDPGDGLGGLGGRGQAQDRHGGQAERSDGGEADDELAHVEVFLLKRGAPCAPCPNLY